MHRVTDNSRPIVGPTDPPIQQLPGSPLVVMRPDLHPSPVSSVEIYVVWRHTSTPPMCPHGLDRVKSANFSLSHANYIVYVS